MQVAEQTPLTAARYGELALEAGIPPGVLNVIQGGAPCCLEDFRVSPLQAPAQQTRF